MNQVEIFGLSSDAGKALNGQKAPSTQSLSTASQGVVTEFDAEKGRWEVMISLEKAWRT